MNNIELRIRVLLTMQVVLLGMVTAKLRSVMVLWNETDVCIRLFFEGALSLEEKEIASEIETEVLSHLPSHAVICRANSCLPSEKVMLLPNEILVFQRAPF